MNEKEKSCRVCGTKEIDPKEFDYFAFIQRKLKYF